MERIFIDDRKNYRVVYNDGTIHMFNIGYIRRDNPQLSDYDIRLFRDIVKYSCAKITEAASFYIGDEPIKIIINCLWNMVDSSKKFIGCNTKDLHIYLKHLRYITNIELFKNSFNRFVTPVGGLYQCRSRRYVEADITKSIKVKLLNHLPESKDNYIINSFEEVNLKKSYDILSDIFETVNSMNSDGSKEIMVKIRNSKIGEFKMYRLLDLAILYTLIKFEDKVILAKNVVFSGINDIYIPRVKGQNNNPGYITSNLGAVLGAWALLVPPTPRSISNIKQSVKVSNDIYNRCDIKGLRDKYLGIHTRLVFDYTDIPKSTYERLIFKYLTLPYTVYTDKRTGQIRVVIDEKEYIYDNTFHIESWYMLDYHKIYELVDLATGEFVYFSSTLANESYDKISMNTADKPSVLGTIQSCKFIRK